MRWPLVLVLFLLAASAEAQTTGCQGGSSPATCSVNWSAGTGRIMLPAASVAAIDCTVREGTRTLFSGVVGVGATVSFSVAPVSGTLQREVTADCRNTAGKGPTTFALATFPGIVPDAPVLP